MDRVVRDRLFLEASPIETPGPSVCDIHEFLDVRRHLGRGPPNQAASPEFRWAATGNQTVHVQCDPMGAAYSWIGQVYVGQKTRL